MRNGSISAWRGGADYRFSLVPDEDLSQAEYSRLVDAAASGGEIYAGGGDGEVLAKDTDNHDSHGGMFTKGWHIEQGYLSLPSTRYGGEAGLEIGDEGLLNITVGGSVSGVIDTTGDTDDIRVFLVAGQTYHVSLRGSGATPLNDSFLMVFDPTAALVNYDDDGGNDLYSMMTFTASATGNYTIRAASFSNPGDPGTGGYTVDVRVQGADAVGDTNATAVVHNIGDFTFGFRETATVSGGADLDRYEVTLEAGHYYTFKLAAGADYETDYTAVPFGEIDTILRLRNAAGTLLASNDDNSFPSDISSGIGFYAETSGTYYIDVTGYAGQTGGYLLQSADIDYQNLDPLDAIRWKSADNIDTVDVNGVPTAYVYFGLAGENFGQSNFAASWGWTAKEKAAVMSALLEFTKITGIQYVETLDQSQAEFRLNTVNGPNPPVSYGAYMFPQDPVYGAAEGVSMYNVNSGGWDKPGVSTQDIPGDQVSLNKGGFSYAVILHEMGHGHGLAHAHDRGGGSDIMLGVTGATNSYGIFNLNQGVYTVMSYNDAWDFHPDGPSPFTISGISQGWSGTLSAFDIAALQERYGVHAYAEGDTVYTLKNTNVGAYYETIWDSGGNDTIAYAGGTGNVRIDLTAATLDYSPTGGGVLSFVDQVPGTAGADGVWGGFTIANGVVIENAIGGDGNDVLIGNAANNRLTGGLGTDTLMGRDGLDTAVFSGVRAASTITRAMDGTITGVNGTDGNDTLSGVERLEFADGTIKYAFADPAQWTATTPTAGLGGWSVGDFNGDGKDDIFRLEGATYGADMHLSTGTSFASDGSWTLAGVGSDGEFYVGDFNGDGMDDLLRSLTGWSDGADVLLSDGTQFNVSGSWTTTNAGASGWYVGDFDGDGTDDILHQVEGTGARVLLSNGASFDAGTTWTPAGQGSDGLWYVGDFDGDGDDDLLRSLEGTGAQVFLSDGAGSFTLAGTWTPAGRGSDGLFHIEDFDGDGKDDILRNIDGTGSQVFLSTGGAFALDGVWSTEGRGDGLYAGDFTGDGNGDLLRMLPGSTEVLI